MKFNEKINNLITIDNYQKTNLVFVYFLIKENDVVYVGQTTKGLARPFSHTNKDFDTVNLLPCSIEDKDIIEDFYIKKYRPKYNKNVNFDVNYTLIRARNKIRDEIENNNFSVPNLKEVVKYLGIKYIFIDAKAYIHVEDVKRIVKFLKEGLKNG